MVPPCKISKTSSFCSRKVPTHTKNKNLQCQVIKDKSTLGKYLKKYANI